VVKKIKVMGLGSVVQKLLSSPSLRNIEVAVYARRRNLNKLLFPANVRILPMEAYQTDDSPTFLCCSVNEEKVLAQNPGKRDRLQVAQHNLALVEELISKEYFDHGLHFILTNPSDLVAEFIFRRTGNTKVFGLGLSVDKKRYFEVFEEIGVQTSEDFDLAGNHWDHPCPLLKASSNLKSDLLEKTHCRTEEELLKLLQMLLGERIKKEFKGFKPPVRSGVEAIEDILGALTSETSVLVSGHSPSLSVFTGGVFDGRTTFFKPQVCNEASAEPFLAQTFLKTKITLEHLMIPAFHKSEMLVRRV